MNFLSRLFSASELESPQELNNRAQDLPSRNLPTLATEAYRQRKQAQHNHRKNRLDTSGRYTYEFRQILDLAALTASLDNLQGFPSSRSADSGSCTCSFPGDWDVKIEGHQFYWRDLYVQHSSAVVWTSKTSKKLIIAIKADSQAHSAFGDHFLPYRRRDEYIRDAYVNPSIYRAAIELYNELSANGFFGTTRPMIHSGNSSARTLHGDRRNEWSITLTGHHHGGAIAQILGMILTEASYRAQVISFGAPKCVDYGTAQRWNYRLPLLRIVNDGDITHQLPLTVPDLIWSSGNGVTFFNTPAHFGRGIILRPEGHFIDQNSESARINRSDSFWHQFFFRGYQHSRSRAGISHPMQYFDDLRLKAAGATSEEDEGDIPALDDYTDTLLLVLNRLETNGRPPSKEFRLPKSNQITRNRSASLDIFDSSGKANQQLRGVPHLLVLIIGAVFCALFGYPLYTPTLNVVDERFVEDPLFRRQQIFKAYNQVYELGSEDPVGSSAAAPPSPTDHAFPSADLLNELVFFNDGVVDIEEVSANLSPVEALELHHDRRNRGIRCADCALFRKREYASESTRAYGALIVYKDPRKVILEPFLRELETLRKQKKSKRPNKASRDPTYAAEAANSLGSKISRSVRDAHSPRSPSAKGAPSGSKRQATSQKSSTRGANAQRQSTKDWARYRMVA